MLTVFLDFSALSTYDFASCETPSSLKLDYLKLWIPCPYCLLWQFFYTINKFKLTHVFVLQRHHHLTLSLYIKQGYN